MVEILAQFRFLVVPLLLLIVGIVLSAFFSGSETGFYRVSRIRLVLDGLDGDWIARGLLWLTNHPPLFVATTLIGNNLANYILSAAIVLLTRAFLGDESILAALLAPVLLSPLIFVYGELFPKTLFYHAPNLLLRRCGPFFFLSTVLFAPVSILVWLLGLAVQALLGQTPLRVAPAMARKELQEMFREGHDAGILLPAQQRLAKTLFSVATQSVGQLCRPVARVPQIQVDARTADVKRVARRHKANLATVIKGRELIGYVRIVDLYLNEDRIPELVRPLMRIPRKEAPVAALLKMQTAKQDMAQVIDSQGKAVGLLFADELVQRLFQGDEA